MGQVSVRNSVQVCEDDGLQNSECLVLATHFVLQTVAQRSQDVGHMIDVEVALVSKLVCPSFNSPEDVFKLRCPQNVQRLSEPSQLFRVGVFSSLTEVVLVVCHQLLNLIVSVILVHAVVLWSARRKGEQRVDHSFTAFLSLYANRE